MYLNACPLIYCNNAVNKTNCIFFDLLVFFFSPTQYFIM